MTDIDAVLFDLDDTLVQYVRSPDEVLQRSYGRLDLAPLFPVEVYYDRYTEFADERDQSNVELCPGAEQVLDTLHGDYRLAVVTNGAPDAQRAKMESVGLDRWIETRVIAGHEISPKPNAESFEIALDSLDATPERAIKVGDSLETDIAGANALGIASIWLSTDADSADHDTTHRIERLDELLALPSLSGR